MVKHFYGFRYTGASKTSVWVNTKYVVGYLYIFTSKLSRQAWLERENLSVSTGLGGGKRESIFCTKAIELVGLTQFRCQLENFKPEDQYNYD